MPLDPPHILSGRRCDPFARGGSLSVVSRFLACSHVRSLPCGMDQKVIDRTLKGKSYQQGMRLRWKDGLGGDFRFAFPFPWFG